MGKALRTSQAARRAGVHEQTIRRWIRRGEISAFYTAGGHIRVDSDELDKAKQKWSDNAGPDYT